MDKTAQINLLMDNLEAMRGDKLELLRRNKILDMENDTLKAEIAKMKAVNDSLRKEGGLLHCTKCGEGYEAELEKMTAANYTLAKDLLKQNANNDKLQAKKAELKDLLESQIDIGLRQTKLILDLYKEKAYLKEIIGQYIKMKE